MILSTYQPLNCKLRINIDDYSRSYTEKKHLVYILLTHINRNEARYLYPLLLSKALSNH